MANQGNLPRYKSILTTNSQLIISALRDGIRKVLYTLHEKDVIETYQMSKILQKVDQQREDAVFDVIHIVKEDKKYFDGFIQCLNDLEYEGLVKTLTGTGSAAVVPPDVGTGSAAVVPPDVAKEDWYYEIDADYFIKCEVDHVKPCAVSFVRDKQGTAYSMQKKNRGICLIINNYFYARDSNNYERKGTEKDAVALTALFKDMEFDVKEEPELKANEIIEKLELYRQQINNSDKTHDCFILFILSHGKEGCVQGTDMEYVNITEIRDCFGFNKCPKLKDKPKLFFIQACQGNYEVRRTRMIGLDSAEPIKDYYLAIAASPGCVAYRNKNLGSWFIQAIVAIFKKHACEESLQDMMEQIKREMLKIGDKKSLVLTPARDPQPDNARVWTIVTTPQYEDKLNKDLFFFPKTGTDVLDLKSVVVV